GGFVRVRFNGQADETVLVDTGAQWTTISPRLATQLHLVPAVRGIVVGYVDGEHPTNQAFVRRLTVGTVDATQVGVLYPDVVTTGCPPLLGMNVLRQCRVLVDYPGRRIFF